MVFSPMIAAAVIPAVTDIAKNVIGAATSKFIGISVDDQIKLEDANVRRLEALAKLDAPIGNPSQWVVDLRTSFRYIAAGVLIAGGLLVALYGLSIEDAAAQAAVIAFGMDTAGAPFGFIFGERMWATFKGNKK